MAGRRAARRAGACRWPGSRFDGFRARRRGAQASVAACLGRSVPRRARGRVVPAGRAGGRTPARRGGRSRVRRGGSRVPRDRGGGGARAPRCAGSGRPRRRSPDRTRAEAATEAVTEAARTVAPARTRDRGRGGPCRAGPGRSGRTSSSPSPSSAAMASRVASVVAKSSGDTAPATRARKSATLAPMRSKAARPSSVRAQAPGVPVTQPRSTSARSRRPPRSSRAASGPRSTVPAIALRIIQSRRSRPSASSSTWNSRVRRASTTRSQKPSGRRPPLPAGAPESGAAVSASVRARAVGVLGARVVERRSCSLCSLQGCSS